MGDNYFVEVRRKSKMKFHQFILENADKNMTTIIGLFSYQNGYRRATLEAWVDELKDAGILEIDHGVPAGKKAVINNG